MQLSPLITKQEFALMTCESTRTIDRRRQTHEVGEVHLVAGGPPRFRRCVIEQAIRNGFFAKKAKRVSTKKAD